MIQIKVYYFYNRNFHYLNIEKKNITRIKLSYVNECHRRCDLNSWEYIILSTTYHKSPFWIIFTWLNFAKKKKKTFRPRDQSSNQYLMNQSLRPPNSKGLILHVVGEKDNFKIGTNKTQDGFGGFQSAVYTIWYQITMNFFFSTNVKYPEL